MLYTMLLSLMQQGSDTSQGILLGAVGTLIFIGIVVVVFMAILIKRAGNHSD